MKVASAVAEILKREGVEFLIGYPVNHIIEAAAEADIRTIIVRQERVGLHMADAVSRVTSGRKSAFSPCSTVRGSRMRLAESPRLSAIPRRSWCCPRVTLVASPTSRRISTPAQLSARHQIRGAGNLRRLRVPTRFTGPLPRSGTAAATGDGRIPADV